LSCDDHATGKDQQHSQQWRSDVQIRLNRQ
jgi:hypothetical protein